MAGEFVMRVLITLGGIIFASVNSAFAADLPVHPTVRAPVCIGGGCGTLGGPGYRDPDGKCVSWESLGRVCGDPPTTRCQRECVVPNAPLRLSSASRYRS